MNNLTVKFNVGGKMFEVNRSLLLKFDDKMMLRVAVEMSDNPNEPIFIDRDGERFVYVLDYMRDGKANLPLSMSKGSFISDLMFYGINVVDNNVILSGNCASQIQLCIKNHCVELQKIDAEATELAFKRECRLSAKTLLDSIIAATEYAQDGKPVFLYLPDFFKEVPANDGKFKRIREIFAEYGFIELDLSGWPRYVKAKTF